MKNNDYYFNEKGSSLVEVLAIVIILSIVGSILFGVIIQGKEQYEDQSQTNQELFDLSYSLKLFTKDLRKALSVESTSANRMTIKDESGSIDRLEYFPIEKKLIKNGDPYIDNVVEFIFSKNGLNVEIINIKLQNESNEISTQIVVRSGN
ncbi:hypothetical protein CD30_07335 [Ureibacillus massiliensis 4400831 = CIP 108448 = CCUG 49529]|uniref:Prepilin-type N-terminal cleavage/methylation domain-containing protein n=1 Tax=Ureibacillus massiliensis 4400831 = CIP 108448 = CCUG 49529 TaxID=1211035 RepID=A0A0A3J2K7_9BACL|nr:hypothetical protein [Ureibacillus massiliensis]KGR91244.1 hypothetical protein CD30_07335 [Ureibacillus massiliensis 4400831 = CIP 108448 = CCUG 49529]